MEKVNIKVTKEQVRPGLLDRSNDHLRAGHKVVNSTDKGYTMPVCKTCGHGFPTEGRFRCSIIGYFTGEIKTKKNGKIQRTRSIRGTHGKDGR